MKSKRVISLLLAGQMLSAPMAQATSLSLLDKAQNERQGRGGTMFVAQSTPGRLVMPSVLPKDEADVVATNVTQKDVTPVATPELENGVTTADIPEPVTSPPLTDDKKTPPPGEVTTPSPAPTDEVAAETPAPTDEMTTEIAAPAETVSPPPAPSGVVATETATPTESGPAETPAPTSEVTTETPAPAGSEEPTPLPTPEITDTKTPAPAEAQGVQAPSAVLPGVGEAFVAAPAVMPLAETPARPGDADDDYPFTRTYVGFGYEIYRAGMPNADGTPARSTRTYTYVDKENKDHADAAEFAVEKGDVSETGEIPLVEWDDYPYRGFASGVLFEKDNILSNGMAYGDTAGWGNAETGYALSDIYIGTEATSRGRYTSIFTLPEIEKWLGRIPDYKFNNWQVSGWGPVNSYITTFNEKDIPYGWTAEQYLTSLMEGMYLWPYINSEREEDFMLAKTIHGVHSAMVPLTYGDWVGNPDYPLGDVITQADIAAIRETILEEENYQDLLTEFTRDVEGGNYQGKYVGQQYSACYGIIYYKDSATLYDDPVGYKTLPLIAHWQLSDDATVVSTAAVNAIDEPTSTASTALYAVKSGEGATQVTDVDLLGELYTDRADMGDTTKAVSFADELATYYADDLGGGQDRTYYLRVTSDIVGVAPEIIATEAFRALLHETAADELGEGAGVDMYFRPAGSASAPTKFARGQEDADQDEVLQEILNDSVDKDGARYLLNNDKFPMRSKWTLKNDVDGKETNYVSLVASLPAEEGATDADKLRDYFNELVIEITSPNGSKVNTFTFYIQRLNDPKLIQNIGNTPYGMLLRDDVAEWRDDPMYGLDRTPQELKDHSWDSFLHPEKHFAVTLPPYSFHRSETNLMGGRANVPKDGVENNKGHYETSKVYWPAAWDDNVNTFTTEMYDPAAPAGTDMTTRNLDLSATAIIAYLDSSFVDPGFTLYDTQGELVELVDADGNPNPNVKRTVELKVSAGKLSVDDMDPDAGTLTKFYSADVGGLVDTKTFSIVRNADGRDQIDLRGAQIVPGYYTIEYVFDDPLSNWRFDSSSAGQLLHSDALTFRRPLIILPIPGDVDMDGAVTAADADLLERGLAAQSSGGFLNADNNSVVNLFKYRVCDANNDGVVDANDVAKIRGYKDPSNIEDIHGIYPYFSRNEYCNVYYYIPLWSDLELEIENNYRARATNPAVNVSGKPTLTLEYLGKHSESFVDGKSLNSIKATDEDGDPVGLDTGDIFWVGVKISNPAALSTDAKGISDLVLTLAYDNTYVTPVALSGGKEAAFDSTNDALWRATIGTYNVATADVASTDTTLWTKGYKVSADGSWSVSANNLCTSKAVLSAEKDWDAYRQTSVTLRCTDPAQLRELGGNTDEYLLRIPFKVKFRTPEATAINALEVVLGMQDFSLCADGTWCAWSASSEPIFGATKNLADYLFYDNDVTVSTGRELPLSSETSTQVVKLRNSVSGSGGKFVYGERVEVYTRYQIENGTVITAIPSTEDKVRIDELLPAGLTIGTNSGLISGTPQETMESKAIRFSIGTNPVIFELSIEKVDLKLTAVAQEIYYGESPAPLTYQYDTSMLKAIDDVDGPNYIMGFENDGSEEQLQKLIGYVAPTMETTMQAGDDIGDYLIQIFDAGGSGTANYNFIYVNGEWDEATKETKPTQTTGIISATSPLIVNKRPLRVAQLTNTTSSVVYNVNEFQTKKGNIEASYQLSGAHEFLAEDLSTLNEYAGKLTPNMPVYGDDKVTITFTAEVSHDPGHYREPYYDLGGKPSDTRPITISDAALKTDENGVPSTDNANYEWLGLTSDSALATITANPIVGILVSKAPGTGKEFSYEYGESIDFMQMEVRFEYAHRNVAGDPNSKYSPIYQFIGDATYNNLGIHITYETLEDIESLNLHWETNSLLDSGNLPVTLAADTHNGKYICVSVNGQVEAEDGSLKEQKLLWRSPDPIVVTRKSMNLTANDILVYYGEYQEGMLEGQFTYNVAQLTEEDALVIRNVTGRAPTGAPVELTYLHDYVPPRITAAVGAYGASDPVAQGTPVRWNGDDLGGYNIYITDDEDENGAAVSGTANYFFRYMKQDENSGTKVVSRDGVGVASLTILPRPIVADVVTLGEHSKSFIYDDTTNTVLETMLDADGVSRKVKAVGLNTAAIKPEDQADTFVAKLPGAAYFVDGQYDEVAVDRYAGKTILPGTAGGSVLTGDAIYTNGGKLDELELTYRADYAQAIDNPSAVPPYGTYFDMNGQLERVVDVTIRGIRLPRDGSNANGNYYLVYANPGPALGDTSAYPGGGDGRPDHQAGAKARIVLRPLESMSIAKNPSKTEYSYGDTLTLSGMSLRLKLGNLGDNAPVANQAVISRVQSFNDYGNGEDSFSEQGLKVYWMTDELAAMDAAALETYLKTSGNIEKLELVEHEKSYPDVAKTGKKLLVVGRRSNAQGAEALGHVLTFAVTDGWNINVKKKIIPITVEDMNRYYGEPNDKFRAYYTFDALAQPDQEKLQADTPTLTGSSRLYLTAVRDAAASVAGVRDVSTIAVNNELTQLNGGSANLAVRFVTDGMQSSDAGRYEVSMELLPSGRDLANYDFLATSNTTASLRVFRRPIDVSKILQNPVSTIYNNTTEVNFPAIVEQEGQMASSDVSTAVTGFMTALPVTSGSLYISDDDQVKQAQAEGVALDLTLTGDAIYSGGDKLALSMTVVFKPVDDRATFTNANASQYQIPDSVTIKDLALIGTKEEGYQSGNYWLVYGNDPDRKAAREPADKTATGQLDRRPIIGITVNTPPKMEYTYGQPLNLNALSVIVQYKKLEGYDALAEADKYPLSQELSYRSLIGRMTVNYWKDPMAPDAPVTDPSDPGYEASQAMYRLNVSNCPAVTGDHLTIAPSHEERFQDKTNNNAPISHDGKYLILTAREDKSLGYEAPAVVVRGADGQPLPIQIKKLDLGYALTAADKTYNDADYAGRDITAGTITLKNVYEASAADRDLVYVSTDMTDAAYGGYATDAAALEALRERLNDALKTSDAAYTFQATGAPGSTGLTFTFYDENVMYFDQVYTAESPVTPEEWAGYWASADHSVKQPSEQGKWDVYGDVAPMPVLVSSIELMGPDAENYTLDSWVGQRSNVAALYAPTSENNGDKDQVPYATIHKAEQVITSLERPVVSVDVHTNAVKLTYDAAGSAFAQILNAHSGDEYNEELHYEYGLQHMEREADPENDTPAVMAQWGDWSDRYYFGGEKLVVEESPYAPELSDEDKNSDIVKGQLYAWAEDDKAFGAREPLDRDKVYWGMVKLSETHNYNASAPILAYGDLDDASAQKAEAEARSAALSREVLSWVENTPDENFVDPSLDNMSAVKTYKQSFEIISAAEINSGDAMGQIASTLEAVWFSDVQYFTEEKQLSAVLRNLVEPRYYEFYWDETKKTKLDFNQGLDLSESNRPFLVEIEVIDEADPSKQVKKTVEVNIGDDPENPRPNSAVIYATVKPSNNGTQFPDKIIIGSGGAAGGDAAGEGQDERVYELSSGTAKLEVTFKPAAAVKEGLIWSSSDPHVVQVDPNGVLTFVGVGTAEVTAVTRLTRKSATVKITVKDTQGLSRGVGTAWETSLALSQREENRFNFYCTEAFFDDLDQLYQFYPEREVTRSELALILARLYLSSEDWEWSGSSSFPDLMGDEDYAEAVERLYRGGIIEGLPDGTFSGAQSARRSEVSTILCRMMGLPPAEQSGEEPYFVDCNHDNHWAAGYVEALAKANVVNGTGDFCFMPDRYITRAELAAMLSRLLLTGANYGAEPIIPIDVHQTHWAYWPILRAVNTVKKATPES